jgi:hypothetical protein
MTKKVAGNPAALKHGKRSLTKEFVVPGVAVRRTASLPLAYVPGIHVFAGPQQEKTWMAGTSPAMPKKHCPLD